MQPIFLKRKAIKLREKGYSYNLISQNLGISKSTLSAWFKDIPFHPNKIVLERIKSGPMKSGKIRHDSKVKNIENIKKVAKKEIGEISKRDLWMIGLGLYLGEGSKLYESVRIINSDPEIIKLAINWLKEICELKNENMTIAIHLYPDNNIKQCLNFWSKFLNLPLKQFKKTQIDIRKNKSEIKKRKLPYGTAHIRVISNGNPKLGVNLHRKIMGWIDGIIDQK